MREVAVTGNFMILQTNYQVATATGSGTLKESAYTHIVICKFERGAYSVVMTF